ncbi:hypothetical protein HNO88_002426 [Novosphingobium chloroacetimidivorans]|uniref:Uncharacterized protein n=1 Tax=Novosphingobium chloroacetimidivorans TaxID=1428314 RepID=A0A7W7NXE0_9SPHN|nr:hypothetical protein [Novosphingobium chloroacetimidivorans]MBB4859100.1 hypothetical protein [Novosphingobium chloroacetimidivorans]
MDGGTLIGRLDQIEAALDRIEALAARTDGAPAAGQTVVADADLQTRHEALRLSVRASIARLDALIERGGPDQGTSA